MLGVTFGECRRQGAALQISRGSTQRIKPQSRADAKQASAEAGRSLAGSENKEVRES